MEYSIAMLPGDGIGPEVLLEGQKILSLIGSKFGHDFRFKQGLIGGAAIDCEGTALPESTISLCKDSDAVLLGAVGGPKWDDPNSLVRPEQGLLGIRKELELFANLRPIKVYKSLVNSSPVKPDVLHGVDMLVVRELTGGLYFAKPKRRYTNAIGRSAVDTLRYNEVEVRRILEFGFELAQGRKGKVTSVDKANVLESSRLWREIAEEVSLEYPEVELDHVLIDTAAMQLIQNPAGFDVIVTENTFGDILTDEASVLSGSMGLLPSASLSTVSDLRRYRMGLYEPIHGSAPNIAGLGIANPIAAILSAAMLLRISFAMESEARLIETAVEDVLDSGIRTKDLALSGEKYVSTVCMGKEIGERVWKSGIDEVIKS
jgi:3-isopropylmalate dehydrogenase